MTYSLVGCDLERREWGVAVESKFLAVGAVVPSAEAETGAVATQALANVRYGTEGLRLLRESLSADETLQRVVGADDGRAHRQLGIVDRLGRSATYTGSACLDWAGGRSGPCYAAQGNILVSAATVDALAETFEASEGRPLAERLLAALAAAQQAGGDRRGQQSAALLVTREEGGYGGGSDRLVDLRIDDHPAPVDELVRLYELRGLYFGQTPEGEWLEIDDTLAAELRERLHRLGYSSSLAEGLGAWAGVENLEERVSGAARIDPVVLEELRRR
jgi:uncharacterized Ntn-hydrolase superfamily protein